MRRAWIVVAGGALLLAIASSWFVPRMFATDISVIDVNPAQLADKPEEQSVGLCPWRDPEGDRKRFFPTSTGEREDTLILSRHRQEIEKRLGRKPTGEENALQIHRILEGEKMLGAVVTRRIRGEAGVIELVLATGTDSRIRDVKIQRLREPEPTATALRSPSWLGAFRGKTANADWQLGKEFPDVPAAAQPSARAVLDGARTAMVLLDIGNRVMNGN